MADRRREGGHPGWSGAGPGYNRSMGRDMGGGPNSGLDGAWGAGYGASAGQGDYREGFGGEDYGGGFSGGDYDRSFGGRGEGFTGERPGGDVGGGYLGGVGPGATQGEPGQVRDDREWWVRRGEAREQAHLNEGPHRGRGPQGHRRSDQRIHEDICEAMADDRLLDPTDIEVRVDDGEVVLEGQVGSRVEKRLAEDLAERCSGVGHVQNNLRVREGSGRDRLQSLVDRYERYTGDGIGPSTGAAAERRR